MANYPTSGRQRAGFNSIRPQAVDNRAPARTRRFKTDSQRLAARLPLSQLWLLGMAALIAAPLVAAGAFGQLPWQVDSWSRTATNPGPPGAPPPGSGSSSEAAAVAGTPAGGYTPVARPASPIAQSSFATPAASPVPATVTATATTTETAEPATPTPSPTPPAAATSATDAEPETGMVVTAPLNVRTAPGLDAGIRAVLPTGTQLTVTGGPRDVDGYDWYEVSAGGVTGWAAGEFLEPA